MATNNVPNVNASLLNSTSVRNTQETLEEQRREEEREKYRREVQSSNVSVATKKVGVSSSAEPKPPAVRTTTAHERIKTAHTDLKKAFVEAGGKGGKEAEQNLETKSVDQLETLQNEIDTLIEKGAPEIQIEKLEAKRKVLLGALDEYRAAHAEAEVATETEGMQTVQTASSSEETGTASGGEAPPMTPEEQELWADLDAQIKTVGLDRGGETNVEEVQKKFMTRIASEVTQLQAKDKELTEKFNEVHAKWKSTTDPKAKAEYEKSLHELKTLHTENSKILLSRQKLVMNVATTSDALLSYHVSKELGLNAAPQKPMATKSAKVVRSASVSDSSSQTESATQKSGGSQAGLTAQSATGPVSAAGGPGAGEDGPLLGTASANEGDAYVSPEVTLARTAALDNTGTTMSIASTGHSVRSEARRLDKLIKRLIMAAQSGNMEAVVSGLLFLGKRQNILTTSMGAQTLVAMQQYEKQLGVISNQIGALKPSPDYSSKLAKLNADMNIYSSSRQMITQTFRDFLNAKEQVEELGHSVIGKLGQLGSRLASFQ